MTVQKTLSRAIRFADVVEGALSRVKNKFYKNFKNLSKKAIVFSLAGNLMAITSMVSIIPMTDVNTNQVKYNTNVKYNQNSASIVSLEPTKTTIEIGDSKYTISENERKDSFKIKASSTERVSVKPASNDPTEFRPVYQAAAKQFGIPWQLIESVHQVESGKSGSTTTTSYAGAQGPMQFMPGTWRAYKIDGNGDGTADINNVVDAIYTGANYLAKSGADEGRIDDALFNYNHSRSYVALVKGIAIEIGLPQ